MICLSSLSSDVKMLLVNRQHQISALLSLLEKAQSMTNKEAIDANETCIVKPSDEISFKIPIEIPDYCNINHSGITLLLRNEHLCC